MVMMTVVMKVVSCQRCHILREIMEGTDHIADAVIGMVGMVVVAIGIEIGVDDHHVIAVVDIAVRNLNVMVIGMEIHPIVAVIDLIVIEKEEERERDRDRDRYNDRVIEENEEDVRNEVPDVQLTSELLELQQQQLYAQQEQDNSVVPRPSIGPPLGALLRGGSSAEPNPDLQ